jgi:dTDP-4-dehydrorhamnose 3,5-epimerase
MRLIQTALADVCLIEPDVQCDERGTFAKHFSEDWYRRNGLQSIFLQSCMSTNRVAGTLRGMHWQAAPCGEVKLVRCVRGAIYDVVIDLRPESLTFRRWHAATLTPESGTVLYVPVGCAHGYQTLVDDSWVAYEISAPHEPKLARGVRWDDPAFSIEWPPCDLRLVSVRDASYADFEQHE